VRAASLGERQALGHDRVDLVLTEQLDEVLPEPLRVAGTPPTGPPNSPRTLLAVRKKKSPRPNDRDVNPFDASRHRSELCRVVRHGTLSGGLTRFCAANPRRSPRTDGALRSI
jgi:hypothetical protein